MQDVHLEAILKRWIRRERVRRCLHWAGYGALAGGVFGLALALYAILSKDLLAAEYLRLAGSGFGAALAAGLLMGLLWPVDRYRAAQRFDLQFRLQERMSTALEILAQSGRTTLQERQLADTAQSAAQVDVRKHQPLTPRGPAWPVAAVLAAACIGFWFAAGDLFSAAGQTRAVQETIEEEASRVEALIEAIESDPDLSDTQKDVLLAPLEQALTALNQTRSLEEAFSAVELAREQLQALEDPEAVALSQTLRQAGESLADGGAEPLNAAAERLAEGELQAAAETLRDIDISELTAAERATLAEQLDELAEAVGEAAPELAETLQQAAQAAENADAQAASDALQRAAEALENIQEQNAASQAAAEAAASLEDAQDAIVQAGQASGEGQAAAGATQEGGQNSLPGQQASGGSGEGSGNSSADSGLEAGSQEISQGNNPDGAGLSSFEPIAPAGLSGEGSDWVAVPSSGETGENVTGTGPASPGAASPLSVPYSEVFAQYEAAVNQAIDRGLIPPQYRSLIRDYFTSLEP